MKNKKILLVGLFIVLFFGMAISDSTVVNANGCCIRDLKINSTDNCNKNVDNAAACQGTFLDSDPDCNKPISLSNCSGVSSTVGCCIVDAKDSTKLGPENCQSNKKKTDCSGSNSMFEATAPDCSAISGVARFCTAAVNNNIAPPEPGGLVPCGRSGQSACTLCHLISGFSGLVKYLMGLLVTIALAGLFFSGVMYIISAGDDGMMKSAKGFATACVTGFAIVLGAWLIINITLWVVSANFSIIGKENWYSFTVNCN